MPGAEVFEFTCATCGRARLAQPSGGGLHAEEARAIGWRQDYAGLLADVTSPLAGKWYCPFHGADAELSVS